MRRFRKWLIGAVVALALLLPSASLASADPGDGGVPLTYTRPTTLR